jgi:methyl-accepting chemotaxis protein
MNDILGSIRRVDALVRELEGSTANQTDGISQVGQAMAQLDEGTQQNAALVEQSAAAAESLNQQSQQLLREMAKFRLAPTH